MIFRSLEISRDIFSRDNNKIKGNIQLNSDDNTSTIYLNMTEEHIKSIFELIEPQLNEVLRESIQALRNEVGYKEEVR